MDSPSRVQINGFHRPFHPFQLLSWVVFGLDVLLFVIFCLPLVAGFGPRLGVILCYTASVVILVLGAFRATRCDPADPHIMQRRGGGSGMVVKAEEEAEGMLYCRVCDVEVGSRSKHCSTCNKCIDKFDHHCMWLNNCVGRKNYREFLAAITSTAMMTGIILCTSVYLLVDSFANEDAFDQRMQDTVIFANIPKGAFVALPITMVILNMPLFLLDMQLVFLHLFLLSQNLTTYEYIIYKLNKAKGEKHGKDTDTVRLAMGKLRHQIRTLPHCMDWIFFCRCGQKRAKKYKKNSINPIDSVDFNSSEPKSSNAPCVPTVEQPPEPPEVDQLFASTCGTEQPSSVSKVEHPTLKQSCGAPEVEQLLNHHLAATMGQFSGTQEVEQIQGSHRPTLETPDSVPEVQQLPRPPRTPPKEKLLGAPEVKLFWAPSRTPTLEQPAAVPDLEKPLPPLPTTALEQSSGSSDAEKFLSPPQPLTLGKRSGVPEVKLFPAAVRMPTLEQHLNAKEEQKLLSSTHVLTAEKPSGNVEVGQFHEAPAMFATEQPPNTPNALELVQPPEHINAPEAEPSGKTPCISDLEQAPEIPRPRSQTTP